VYSRRGQTCGGGASDAVELSGPVSVARSEHDSVYPSG